MGGQRIHLKIVNNKKAGTVGSSSGWGEEGRYLNAIWNSKQKQKHELALCEWAQPGVSLLERKPTLLQERPVLEGNSEKSITR